MALMISPTPWLTFFDDEGVIVPGGKLFTYAAGTADKLATYTDVDGQVANTNPIILDVAGRVPSGFFLLPAAYKFVLAPPDDTDPPTDPIRTQDDIIAPAPFSIAVVTTGTAGENIGPNMSVYLSQGDGSRTAGRWYKTDADFNYASSTAVKIGWATDLITTGSLGQIQEIGSVTTGTLVTPGTVYYASATAGSVTATAPVNQRKVGIATSASTLLIGVEQPWTATAVPVATADFPTAANAGVGAIVQRTNGVRGLWASQAGNFVALNGQVANAADFGAIGDDSTDNAAFIQAAIDALPSTGGTVYLPAGIYRTTARVNLAVDNTRIVGDGPTVTTIKNSAGGAVKISARFCGLENIGILYTGAGTQGVLIDNATTVPQTGPDRVRFDSVKIKGGAGTANGLWMANSIHGVFNDVYMPCGGGTALRMDGCAFNLFKDLHITTNLNEGSPQWTDGILMQKQIISATESPLQCDDNTFINACVEGATRHGIYITSTIVAGPSAGAVPARNVFLGGVSESNATTDVLIENGQDNRFYGMHGETATHVYRILGNVGNHINKFFGCSGQLDIENPGSAQGIQGTFIYGHSGNITIVGANVFGTQIWGASGTVADSGTNTILMQTLLASSPSSVTVYKFNGRVFTDGPLNPVNTVQGSAGAAVTILALAPNTYGTVYVRGTHDTLNDLAYYEIDYVNGSVAAIGTPRAVTAGTTEAQMTFSLSGANLQAIGANATPPAIVKIWRDYFPY
jgi:hypothetical protein